MDMEMDMDMEMGLNPFFIRARCYRGVYHQLKGPFAES